MVLRVNLDYLDNYTGSCEYIFMEVQLTHVQRFHALKDIAGSLQDGRSSGCFPACWDLLAAGCLHEDAKMHAALEG